MDQYALLKKASCGDAKQALHWLPSHASKVFVKVDVSERSQFVYSVCKRQNLLLHILHKSRFNFVTL
ncbi:hypothetical protein KIN20_013451 [Parelaphostrongylus tenuis]|uniref:Uncharacterized protein n=1 Tax=Parelaphostrongylus tenuis TaxID=148309 RepID=A0AAD5QNU5_PARTN|nr:hypothetical protein KIN20_013451 [Parelaphostrongylus tenuis]